MRILICGTNYFPELVGIGKYTGEMAEELVAMGHEVRIVTAPPHYPAWEISQGYHPWLYKRENLNNVTVFRCPVWVKKDPSGLHRIVHLLSFAISSAPVILGQWPWRPDIVLAIEPPLTVAPMAWLLAKLSGAKAWLHIQDYEVDAALNLGLLPSVPGLDRILRASEALLLRGFDCVSTISERMKAFLPGKGVRPAKSILFPNWVDTEKIYPLTTPSPLRQKLGIAEDRVVLLYAGTMNQKQGLDLLIDAAERLQDRSSIHFLLVGEGPTKAHLQSMVQSRGLTNVTFNPFVPFEELNELLNVADTHMLIQSSSVADVVMPSKLTGMMASGRSIIATAAADTAVGEAMAAANCGVLVEPGNLEELVQAAISLADSAPEREQMGRNARQYAEDYMSKSVILQKFEMVANALINGNKRLNQRSYQSHAETITTN